MSVRRHDIKLGAAGQPSTCGTCLQVYPCEVAQLQHALRGLYRKIKEVYATLDDSLAGDDDETADTNIIPIVRGDGSLEMPPPDDLPRWGR